MAKKTETLKAAGEADEAMRSLDLVESTLGSFLAAADVSRAFGEPIRDDETTLIPAAETLTVMGFGAGSGNGQDTTGREASGGGGGGGGGGQVLTRAVAVVVASPDGVRVEPVIDFTKIALAALTAGGFMLATWLGMGKPPRSL